MNDRECHGCGYQFSLETREERKQRWFQAGPNWFCPDHDRPGVLPVEVMLREELLAEAAEYGADETMDDHALWHFVRRVRFGFVDKVVT